MLPELWDMLSEEEKIALSQERYSVIATNADESISAAEIVAFYRKRGDRSENRIKELKNGFNLSYLPSSDFISNAFYFQIGVIAYNLFILFKKMLQLLTKLLTGYPWLILWFFTIFNSISLLMV